jgi:hypothetical protein
MGLPGGKMEGLAAGDGELHNKPGRNVTALALDQGPDLLWVLS